jgi:cytochrome c biogenesis protein CcmG/thiol:disulfide interchange protein DsbE
MRALPFLLFLCLSAALAWMLVHPKSSAPEANVEARPFPALTLQTLDGKTAWGSDTVKGRVTLVNFFASWCTPCAAEMPEFSQLEKRFPAIHLAGIAWNDKPATLNRWLKEHGKPFDSVWLDARGDATIGLGIKGIPETFVIDANGMIRYHIRGPLSAEERTQFIEPLLEELLEEAAHAS